MRKILFGAIIGAMLMFSAQSFASDISLVGKKVGREVKVRMFGEEIQKKALLVEGSAYVSIKAVADNLGLEAKYMKGEVIVTQKEKVIEPDSADLKELKEKISINNGQIEYYNSLIASLREKQNNATTERGKLEVQAEIDTQTIRLKAREELGKELEKQLAELEG